MNVQDRSFFIHVGMPKTGTTFLQHQVFPYVKDVHYWKMFEHPVTYYLERLSNNNYLTYPEEWKQQVKTHVAQSKKGKNLISFEGFFGSYTNNYKSNFTNSLALKELFPDARIILVIREQCALIESNYAQVIKEGYGRSFKQYVNYSRGKFGNNRSESTVSLNIESLHYTGYVRNYVEQFGKENVLVLPYEMLRSAPEVYLERLSRFMDVEIEQPEKSGSKHMKVSLSHSGLGVTRFLNRFFVSRITNGGGFIPRTPYYNALRHRGQTSAVFRLAAAVSNGISPLSIARLFGVFDKRKHRLMSPAIKAELRELYAASNRELDEEFQLGLKEYGYYR